MKEGGGVGELGGHGEGDGSLHVAAAGPGGEQGDGGPDPFPAGGHQVASGGLEPSLGVLGGRGELGLELAQALVEVEDLGQGGAGALGADAPFELSSSCERMTCSVATCKDLPGPRPSTKVEGI